jgi:AraC family transcriptional regulator, transcriptional activator of pobA
MKVMSKSAIPRFFLYGEPPRDADAGFLHVETIADRSRLYDWEIRAHAHRDLHQILLILAGGGEMRAESVTSPFRAPALLLVPATVVHAFAFERETRGYVVTIAAQAMQDAGRREPAFASLFDAVGRIELSQPDIDTDDIEKAVLRLQREIVWQAPAHQVAAEACLITLLVAVVRALSEHSLSGRQERGPRAALVLRFRDALEANFRSGWDVARYAKELRVSPSRLRAACLDVTGKPPTHLVHDRIVLEAKRSLTYTNMTIAETAYQLGFTDPAYFSRFFSERVGESPAAFRRRTTA